MVSLIPATTELLFAIGAGPVVVGRTAWCDYPAAAARVPNLGDGIAPNVEAVLASRPDLVILYNSAQNADIAARLRELGIAALRLNTDSLGDVERVGRLLGRLTGHVAGRGLDGGGVRHRARRGDHARRRPAAPRCCSWSGSSRR